MIGAGIVGLAIAWSLRRRGCEVMVVDRDVEGDKASYVNAGGIAVSEVIPASGPGVLARVPGWLLDPLGPLSIRPGHVPRLIPWLLAFAAAGRPAAVRRSVDGLAALNLRTYDDLLPLLDETGLMSGLHRDGALAVYETETGFARDRHAWAVRREKGIVCDDLSGDEARRLEPALGSAVHRAVFLPQWSHVDDPKGLVVRLRDMARGRGVAFHESDVRSVDASACLHMADGTRLQAGRVVIAAGAWSGQLTRQLGERVLLESERGYNLTIADSGVSLNREVIFAERSFVATPLAARLRIGGAAEFGGLDAKPNYARADALATLALRYLPGLDLSHGERWAGHRPATPDSLPVIGRSPRHPAIFYAFGHGHLGLTQAATTARIIADLICDRPPPIDPAPYSIARFG